jgi:hypothetical protein
MRSRPLLTLSLLLACVVMVLVSSPARTIAQTETPTPAPTAAYVREIPLASGDTFTIERSITYGDIAVVTVGVVLLVAIALNGLLNWSQRWLK